MGCASSTRARSVIAPVQMVHLQQETNKSSHVSGKLMPVKDKPVSLGHAQAELQARARDISAEKEADEKRHVQQKNTPSTDTSTPHGHASAGVKAHTTNMSNGHTQDMIVDKPPEPEKLTEYEVKYAALPDQQSAKFKFSSKVFANVYLRSLSAQLHPPVHVYQSSQKRNCHPCDSNSAQGFPPGGLAAALQTTKEKVAQESGVAATGNMLLQGMYLRRFGDRPPRLLKLWRRARALHKDMADALGVCFACAPVFV
jgi:hypothetical protein